MRGSVLLDTLVDLAGRRGLRVRREAMTRGVSSGGMCVLKGVPTVFVDDRASIDAQIEVLATVLRRLDWTDVVVPSAVRSLLGAGLLEDRGADVKTPS
jgi:hypothetical protein